MLCCPGMPPSWLFALPVFAAALFHHMSTHACLTHQSPLNHRAAWSQRLFVLRAAPAAAIGTPQEAYDREVDFAAGKAALAPHSEAAWEALRAMAALPGAPGHALAADARFLALARQALGRAPAGPPALALLADVFLEQAGLLSEAASAAAATEAGSASAEGGAAGTEAALDRRHAAAAAAEARRLARQALERLAAADPIKRPYLRLELAALAAA